MDKFAASATFASKMIIEVTTLHNSKCQLSTPPATPIKTKTKVLSSPVKRHPVLTSTPKGDVGSSRFTVNKRRIIVALE